MSTEEIIKAAIKKYGSEAQKLMAIEEMAELTTAISHNIRGREHNVPEEIADVEIMLKQLKIIFNCKNEVAIIKCQKLARLQERLNDV